MKTPWGTSQTVSRPTRGITAVTTSSHGGIHLTNRWNKHIPADVRDPDGWYEEDCEVGLIMYYLPHQVASLWPTRTPQQIQDNGHGVLERWFPHHTPITTNTPE